ncbi:transposase [Geobacillus subterraneus]|uniref:transposase n=1 Tax=Geobacillus subterraneus TaxID=129338 RepID=UPI001442C7E8|nr:transposase [Geobacillus subterraneus]QIZ68958.1 transposase [Geobacillus subterraneus]WPZ20033.1 transposase [Geobacillus subterraneus]
MGLTPWFDRYLFIDCSAVRRIAKALVIGREAVLSCAIFPYSDGVKEETNNKIKLIKRREYRYRNILHIRLKTSICR